MTFVFNFVLFEKNDYIKRLHKIEKEISLFTNLVVHNIDFVYWFEYILLFTKKEKTIFLSVLKLYSKL